MDKDRYCLLTSGVPAAIAVVEISGPGSFHWLDRHWVASSALAKLNREGAGNHIIPSFSSASLKLDRIRYGTFLSKGIVSALHRPEELAEGESIVLCRTRDQSFELHCHGGTAAASNITRSLSQAGFEKITFGASISSRPNGQSGSIERHAMEDLQLAISVETASVLMDQGRGALSNELRSIIARLEENDLAEAQSRLEDLLAWSGFGIHLVQPWRVVLAGPPNAGKSSLLNAILGYQRAIVHEQAGTTRDLLQEHTSLDGWPVLITDSAGIRNTSDCVESEGIAASLDAVRSSDCLLLLVAPEFGWQTEHDRILAAFDGSRVLVIETKSDIGTVAIPPAIRLPKVATSVHDAGSVSQLLRAVARLLVPEAPASGQGIPFRPEQVRMIQCAIELIGRGQPSEAVIQLKSLF